MSSPHNVDYWLIYNSHSSIWFPVLGVYQQAPLKEYDGPDVTRLYIIDSFTEND